MNKTNFTLIYLLKIGNKANHSIAKDINPKTWEFEGNLEANKTEENIAAFVDNEPGNLLKNN